MKLLFKQRFFSWFDSYDVYDEHGERVFTVEGKLGWGHVLHVLDRSGRHVGTVRERVLTLFEPKFEIYRGGHHVLLCDKRTDSHRLCTRRARKSGQNSRVCGRIYDTASADGCRRHNR